MISDCLILIGLVGTIGVRSINYGLERNSFTIDTFKGKNSQKREKQICAQCFSK